MVDKDSSPHSVNISGKVNSLEFQDVDIFSLNSHLKGPPENGGKPRPKTAPISPSRGVARIPSCKLETASFANLIKHMMLRITIEVHGRLEDWLSELDSISYLGNVVYEHDIKVFYPHVEKAIYGVLAAFLL